jgi:hypothetical protein
MCRHAIDCTRILPGPTLQRLNGHFAFCVLSMSSTLPSTTVSMPRPLRLSANIDSSHVPILFKANNHSWQHTHAKPLPHPGHLAPRHLTAAAAIAMGKSWLWKKIKNNHKSRVLTLQRPSRAKPPIRPRGRCVLALADFKGGTSIGLVRLLMLLGRLEPNGHGRGSRRSSSSRRCSQRKPLLARVYFFTLCKLCFY